MSNSGEIILRTVKKCVNYHNNNNNNNNTPTCILADEERITVRRPRDHEIRLCHRPISTVKPTSSSPGNINTHLPKSRHGIFKKS